jgi:hypothetical protein
MMDAEEQANLEAAQATQSVLDARDAYIDAWRRWRDSKVMSLDLKPSVEAALVEAMLKEVAGEESEDEGAHGEG